MLPILLLPLNAPQELNECCHILSVQWMDSPDFFKQEINPVPIVFEIEMIPFKMPKTLQFEQRP